MFDKIFNNKKSNPVWQFITNGNADMNSVESTDTESFQKVPIDSLARELTQNSLDARVGEKPAVIEFKTFTMRTIDIPGIKELKDEISACINFYPETTMYHRMFEKMLDELEKENILCLRISDFNTSGLDGVASNKNMTPFNFLVKGNGFSSKKGANSGGSKGMGKFSTFLSSSIHTVFYSTLNQNKEKGYMGVVKLGAREIDDDSGLMTTGKGYFSIGERISPILEDLNLDKDFKREKDDVGTDVYVLGFKKPSNWETQIIAKVLDSFMVAIDSGDLEVKVEDKEIINKETLQSFVYDTKFYKVDKRNIESQYELLHDKFVHSKEVDIHGRGTIEFKLKEYHREEREKATNKCIMIRHPYMKIKDLTIGYPVAASAMCIIKENELNQMLKNIENAEHTNWEPKRIETITGDPLMEKEMRSILSDIKDELDKFVLEALLSGKSERIDLEFAGDFLPDLSTGDDNASIQQEPIPDIPNVGEVERIKDNNKFGTIEDENANSITPDIGSHIEEGDESIIPDGNNSSGSGDVHEGENETGFNPEGDDVVMRKVRLSNLKPKVLMIDKKNGKYLITYKAPDNISSAELEFYYLDDNDQEYTPTIKAARINSGQCNIEDNKIVGFTMKKDEVIKLELETDLNDIYACEVKVYAKVSE